MKRWIWMVLFVPQVCWGVHDVQRDRPVGLDGPWQIVHWAEQYDVYNVRTDTRSVLDDVLDWTFYRKVEADDMAFMLNSAHSGRIMAEEDRKYRSEHHGCYKVGCNTCCPVAGLSGLINCTSMACVDY